MSIVTPHRCAAGCWIVFAGGSLVGLMLRITATRDDTNAAFWFVILVGVMLWVAGPLIAAHLLLRGEGLIVSLVFAATLGFFLVIGIVQLFARDAWRRPEPGLSVLAAVLAGSYLGAAFFTGIAWKRRKAHESLPPPLPAKQ